MVDRLRDRTERFLESQALERYELSLSELREPNLGELYAGAEQLFGLDQISQVQRQLAGAAGEEEKRSRYLLAFLVAGRAARQSAVQIDERMTWERFASVTGAGWQVGIREARSRLAETADPEVRHAIEEARQEALSEQEHVPGRAIGIWRDVVLELGYGAYVETWQLLSGVDLRALARDGERFLAETDQPYHDLLDRELRRQCGVSLGEATAADLPRLMVGTKFDRFFADSAYPRQPLAVFTEAGLDLPESRLELQENAPLSRLTGACAYTLEVPDRVVLAASQHSCFRAQAALLDQFGYALHRCTTSAELPLEFRWLGDESVSLGLARLFGGIHGSPIWLSRVHGISTADRDEIVRFQQLLRLVRLRGAIGRLIWEIALYDGDGLTDRSVYTETMKAATGLRHDPRQALWDVSRGFAAAANVRAEQLGALLGEHFRERFDEDWYRNPKTGPALLPILESGRTYTAAEIAVQLTSKPLSFASLL